MSVPGGGRELVRRTVATHVHFVASDTQIYRFLVRPPAQAPGISILMRGIARFVEAALLERADRSGVPIPAAQTWSLAIVGMVHHAADDWSRNPEISEDELVDHLVDLLWNGLASLGPNSTDEVEESEEVV